MLNILTKFSTRSNSTASVFPLLFFQAWHTKYHLNNMVKRASIQFNAIEIILELNPGQYISVEQCCM